MLIYISDLETIDVKDINVIGVHEEKLIGTDKTIYSVTIKQRSPVTGSLVERKRSIPKATYEGLINVGIKKM